MRIARVSRLALVALGVEDFIPSTALSFGVREEYGETVASVLFELISPHRPEVTLEACREAVRLHPHHRENEQP